MAMPVGPSTSLSAGAARTAGGVTTEAWARVSISLPLLNANNQKTLVSAEEMTAVLTMVNTRPKLRPP